MTNRCRRAADLRKMHEYTFQIENMQSSICARKSWYSGRHIKYRKVLVRNYTKVELYRQDGTAWRSHTVREPGPTRQSHWRGCFTIMRLRRGGYARRRRSSLPANAGRPLGVFSGAEPGSPLRQSRNIAACRVLVHDALLGRAHQDRLRRFQGSQSRLAIAGLDRLLDPPHEGAHLRPARLVDRRATRDLARGLLGGLRIRHLDPIAPPGVPAAFHRLVCMKAAARRPHRRCRLIAREHGRSTLGPVVSSTLMASRGSIRYARPPHAAIFARTASYPAMARARSAAENGTSGGTVRAQVGSPWIWASSALTPETSALPSNSLRMVTAAARAASSPWRQARAHRSALRLAVAEMQPAKAPLRASRRAASVDGNTAKSDATAAASRAYTMLPEESLRPTMRAPKASRRRRISVTDQGRPELAGKGER